MKGIDTPPPPISPDEPDFIPEEDIPEIEGERWNF